MDAIEIRDKTECINRGYKWDEELEVCINEDEYEEIDPCELPDSLIFRGEIKDRAIKMIKLGHGLKQDEESLIANDYEVLEYGFPEIRSMNTPEKYLERIIPKWAYNEGMNLTTDFDNAVGYAESRNGLILCFDISENEDIFWASDVHLQVRRPEKSKLVAFCEKHGTKCYIRKSYLNSF